MDTNSSFLKKLVVGALSLAPPIRAGCAECPTRRADAAAGENRATGVVRPDSKVNPPAPVTCLTASGVLDVCINGTLGAIIHGSGYVTSGVYEGGITATGSGGQNCDLTFATPSGGGSRRRSRCPARTPSPLVPRSSSRRLVKAIPRRRPRQPFRTGPRPERPASITTKLDDPLTLSGVSFLATTEIDPSPVTYSATTASYQPPLKVGITFAANPNSANPIPLTCGATAPQASVTFTVNNSADNGYDTVGVGNCTFDSLITAAFTATLAMPPNTVPAPLPFPFSATLETSPGNASSGTYTIENGTFAGDSTTLAIGGGTTIATQCPGCTAEPATYAGSPGTMAFTAIKAAPRNSRPLQ